jgi:branched-chain amino acid transport system substrate-binding protein
MTAQVLKAKAANPDSMLIWSALPAPVVILRAAQANGFAKPIFTSYGAGTNDLVAQSGGAAEGLYLYSLRMLSPESVPASDPAKAAITQLGDVYMAAYKVPAPVYAQHAYDAFIILEKALQSIKGPVTREAIRDAVEKVEVSGTERLLPDHAAEPQRARCHLALLRDAAQRQGQVGRRGVRP